ncbi:Vacuolar protein sorting-associated protein 53 [Tritrichomonas musculus]|uniref:Vacuolar protein sorting-associated protein 53 n=1 Tax=Tritrichomonas musculus TaxID=1915356 RepID=A0ABR2LAA2_9EUKA
MSSDPLLIDNIDAQLSTNDFDAVSYIDNLLPDDGSLMNVSLLIQKIQSRVQSTTISLRDAVRSYSSIGNNNSEILNDTRSSINVLSDRIQNIRDQATETENVISRICKDIKPLDNAKKNLTTTVTTLRRLQMMATTIKQLEINIDQVNYSQCAANILALTTFIEDFKKYESAPQLEPLLSKFYDLKRILRNKINTEWTTKISNGVNTQSSLPICAVIDAYAGDFRSSTIEDFCEKFLAPYEDAFRDSGLSEIHSRYDWFVHHASFFNKTYQSSFPKEWRMLYHLARLFCAKTTRHLNRILKKQAQLDVKQYLRAFELTVKFEQKLAELFSTVKTVYIDENTPMPDFPETAEGVCEKYAWIQRRDNHTGEIVKDPANEFIGTIASAFAPHIDVYLSAERANFEKIIKETENRPENDIDNISKTMESSTTLIMLMKSCLDKCAGFNVKQSLLDLFKMLKELLKQYANMLSRIMPTKPKKDEHYILMCCVPNTSSLLLSIVDSLSTKVSSLIDTNTNSNINLNSSSSSPNLPLANSRSKSRNYSIARGPQTETINVDDVKDSVGAELRKQLLIIVDAVIRECDTPLSQIVSNQWQTADFDSGNLPPRLTEILFNRFRIINSWLSNENINRLRSPFAQRVVAAIRDSMFRSRSGNIVKTASRIAIAAKELKIIVQECTSAESDFAKKRIDYEFIQLETELIILCCPDIAMTVTYITKAPKPSKEHFLSIVRLRGYTSSEEQAKYAAEYDKQSQLLKNELR